MAAVAALLGALMAHAIGCVGLSVGTLRSAHLAALDDRIKAAVVVCWMCAFRPLRDAFATRNR